MSPELFSYIMPIATFISIIVGIITISKAFLSVSKELANFKIEMTKELANLKIEVAKQNANFGIVSQRTDKIETDIKELKADFKEQRTESQKLTNKFIDIIADMPKAAIV